VLTTCAAAATAKRTVYASDAGDPTAVRPYAVAADGSISQLIDTATPGESPRGAAITPNGKRLFVANSAGTTISSFSLDSSSGAPSGTTTLPDAGGPAALAITPDGSTLFATNPSGSVSAFALDQFGTATPLPLGGASLPSTGPSGVAVSPDGTRAYVTESTANKLAVLTIGAGGTLTPVSTVDTGAGPSGVVASPDGTRVYVANTGDDNVDGFSVGVGGELSALTNSPYSAGDGATGIAMAADGSRLLVANAAAGSVTPFGIDPTSGALTSQTAVTGLTGASTVAVSPDGHAAYVGGGGKVWAFSFGASGQLAQLGSSLNLSGPAGGIAVSPNLAPFATFDPDPAPATTGTQFVGGTAHDDDGSVVKWHWDFGDGATSNETSPLHAYGQPGTYTVTLTVVDNEGCSTQRVFTGQTVSCAGNASASQSRAIHVPAAPDTTPTPQACQHNGNDGFCGTLDQTAPVTAILGFNDGASITTVDAPDTIGGTITNDPSGIQSVMLRFTKAAGFVTKKKRVRRRVCHKVKGRKRKKCARKWVTKKVKTTTALCQAPSGTKNYLVSYVCSKAPWMSVGGETQFRWDIPVALGLGTYTVDVIATDGAGNADVLEQGRNHMTFKIVNTPSNSDTGTGTGTTTTPTTTAPIDDTGSPFGNG
jgi:DNA-binding beta-propeller fold protein YncE/PKD repeat protein